MIQVLRETREAPPGVQQRIARAGGYNQFGEPNFRIVWGWNRLTLIGGQWTDTDESGNFLREVEELRWYPKYLPFDRWHIEKWLPPEMFGSPQEWFAMTCDWKDGRGIPQLGPYPSRGEYEHCWTVQDPATGAYLGLTPTICDWIVAAIERSRHMNRQDRLTAIYDREAAKDRSWREDAEAVVDDAMPAFHGRAHVVMPTPEEMTQFSRQRSLT